MILIFSIFSFKPALPLSPFTLIKRPSSSPSLSAIRVVPFAYLRFLMFLPPILIPACNLSSLAFLMMCSTYRSNKVTADRCPCLPLLKNTWRHVTTTQKYCLFFRLLSKNSFRRLTGYVNMLSTSKVRHIFLLFLLEKCTLCLDSGKRTTYEILKFK